MCAANPDHGEPEGDEEFRPIEDTPGPLPTTGPPYTRTCEKTDHLGLGQVAKTSSYNTKGNEGREYRFCPKCPKNGPGFLGFCDQRGIRPTNSVCYCGLPARLGVGEFGESGHDLRLWYGCANAAGHCNFWVPKEGGVPLSGPDIKRLKENGDI